MIKRRLFFIITALILVISLAPLGLDGEFDNLNNDIKIDDHLENEYVYDFEDGTVPNDGIIQFSPGYKAWKQKAEPYTAYSGEWVLYSHEVDNFIRLNSSVSHFSAYYSVSNTDYTVTVFDNNGIALDSKEVPMNSQKAYIEFNSTGNDIYEIKISGQSSSEWIIDYVTILTNLDENDDDEKVTMNIIYDFEDGIVPNDDFIEFSPGYAAWKNTAFPFTPYSGEWVLYSHEEDNFIKFSEPTSYFSAYYSVGGSDYTVTAFDLNGEVLNERNIPEYSQTSFVEFFSANNDIYEIRISGDVYQWVIDYITIQTVMDENNFIFELDYYCCDVLGIDQPFNFGGVLEDENGNAFQGEIDVLYGISGPMWEGYYELEYNVSSPNYLNVSLISNSNNLGYYELNITIVLVDVMTLPPLYFEFERVDDNLSSNYEFLLDWYCCDQVEGMGSFDFGGYIVDDNNNSYVGNIDYLEWKVIYDNFEDVTQRHGLGSSWGGENNGYFEAYLTYDIDEELMLGNYSLELSLDLNGSKLDLKFDFERVMGNKWIFEVTHEEAEVYETMPYLYVLEGYLKDENGNTLPQKYDDEDISILHLFGYEITYYEEDKPNPEEFWDYDIEIYYDFESGFLQFVVLREEFYHPLGEYDFKFYLEDDPSSSWLFSFYRLEWPVIMTMSPLQEVIINDDDFYITGTLTDKEGNAFSELYIIDFFIFDLDDPENQERNDLIKSEYLFSWEYNVENGNYLINFSINPEFDPTAGRFGLSFNIEFIKENGDFVWIPLYFEFERLVDSTEPTDTNSTTSDLNNSTTTEISNVTESSTTPQAPQISIPAGLPGFELLFAISSILILPAIRKILNTKNNP